MTAGEAASVMTILKALFDCASPSLFGVSDQVPTEGQVRDAANHLRTNAERALLKNSGGLERIPISRDELANAQVRVPLPPSAVDEPAAPAVGETGPGATGVFGG